MPCLPVLKSYTIHVESSTTNLKKELEKAYTDNTKTSELLEQKKQMDEQNRFHVLIDYVTGMDKNSARVVKTDNN
jgi:hypothetical protein